MPKKKLRNKNDLEPSQVGQLEKTIYTAEYAVVLRLLKELREAVGITQVDLAKQLGQTQSFVSKIERGERRLDIIQLRTILLHFKVSLREFVQRLENELKAR